MLLEARQHDYSAFVTLTYSPENAPVTVDSETGEELLSLDKEDFQKWLKRLRKQVAPALVRFYGCGEYGTQTGRPHYHAIVFGLGAHQVADLEASWKLGYSYMRDADATAMMYTAKYCLKNMGQASDLNLRGRQKTFARMSLRPPIGSSYVPTIAASLMTRAGSTVLVQGHVQKQIRIEGRKYPLDRTMMKKLREEMDIPEEIAKVIFIDNYREVSDEETEEAKAFHDKARRKHEERRGI